MKNDEYEMKDEYPHEVYLREWIVIDKDNWNKNKYLGTIEKARNQNINVALMRYINLKGYEKD